MSPGRPYRRRAKQNPGYVRKLRKSGLHAIRGAQRWVIQSEMTDRVSISSIRDIDSVARGATFFAHTIDRVAGVISSTPSLVIYDDRYDFAFWNHTPIFVEIFESFIGGGVSVFRHCVDRRGSVTTKRPSVSLVAFGIESVKRRGSSLPPIEVFF